MGEPRNTSLETRERWWWCKKQSRRVFVHSQRYYPQHGSNPRACDRCMEKQVQSIIHSNTHCVVHVLTGDATRGMKVKGMHSTQWNKSQGKYFTHYLHSVLTAPLNFTLKNGDDGKFGYMYGVQGTKVLNPRLTRPRSYFTAWDKVYKDRFKKWCILLHMKNTRKKSGLRDNKDT